MIEIRGLVKQFGERRILNHLDLQAKAGEWLVIHGANGAGKTTLLRILAGICSFQFGEVSFNGISVKDDADTARGVTSLVSHQPLLYGDLTAEENLRFFCGLNGIASPDRQIKEFLKLFSLDGNRKQMVRTFSRGMQQRLTLIRALLMEPKALLLDEPLSNLDQDSIPLVIQQLNQFASKGGTILMATHEIDPVRPFMDRVLLLQDGKLIETATPNQKLLVVKKGIQ